MLRRVFLAAAAAVPVVRPAAAAQPATLVYSWPTNVGPVDPHGYAPNQMFAQAMVYEPLVRYAEGGAVEPCLANAWTVSADSCVYTFRLRAGVRFSDGADFDAAVVKANFDAVLINRARHAWLDLVAQIESVDIIDRSTIQLRLRTSYYPTLLELALIRPLRFGSPASIAPIGTGPWKLAESIRGERDVFVRNEAYWGAKPALQRIVVKVVPDATTRALALETGEIDVVYGTDQLDAESFRRFTADPRFVARLSPPLGTRLLAVNSAREPTSDIAVRQAIQYAVDRDALVRSVLLDTEPAANSLFAPNFPYTDVELKPPAFDRAQSIRLLEKSGWMLRSGGTMRTKAGRPLSIDLAFIGTDALQKALAVAIQGELARVGIALRLIGEDAGSFYARQKSGEFGMIFGDTWGAPYDPHAFMGAMRAPSHADYQAQRGLAMKPEIDRRIGAALVSTDEEIRRSHYCWLLRTLHEQAVYLPISYLTNKSVHQRSLDAVPFGPTRYEIPFERIVHSV